MTHDQHTRVCKRLKGRTWKAKRGVLRDEVQFRFGAPARVEGAVGKGKERCA